MCYIKHIFILRCVTCVKVVMVDSSNIYKKTPKTAKVKYTLSWLLCCV